MSEEFVITSDILNNPKFLSASWLARNIYMAMVLATGHEGRASAEPLTWMTKAGLVGQASATIEEVAKALDELDESGLAPRYEINKKQYLFLPGRFEHNTKRTYWRPSKTPPPPIDLLREYPEYLTGLQRLTTKSELRNALRPTENWRYPEYQEIPCTFGNIPESHGNDMGNLRESSGNVPLEVEVGVGNRGGEEVKVINTSVDNSCTLGRESAKTSKSSPPTDGQVAMLGEMAQERSTTVVEACGELGIKELGRKDVSRIKAHLLAMERPDPKKEATKAKAAVFNRLKGELDETYSRDGPKAALKFIRQQSAKMHGGLHCRFLEINGGPFEGQEQEATA